MARSSSLTFPPNLASLLSPYLPTPKPSDSLPFLTLTYATSLDAQLSLAPGVRTTLSGPLSKAMTHHLRTHHSAILIGVNTALADDPALNSRLENTNLDQQPRPIILDPRGRWDFGSESKVMQLARSKEGKAPYVIVGEGTEVNEERRGLLEGAGGKYLMLKRGGKGGRFDWGDVLRLLKGEGLDSVMVEGGGEVINSLLVGEGNRYVDSVVVTLAPTWLGKGGVVVSPDREQGKKQLRVRDVVWVPCGEDVVLCGRVEK
ncbi:dihydrofolate reductase-like domain-containing protein [Cladorrhinum sp. PSN259]|nr:dihydrofolate reductase-like domain-containing protein [Cladorrhinum sp. PSN259]